MAVASFWLHLEEGLLGTEAEQNLLYSFHRISQLIPFGVPSWWR